MANNETPKIQPFEVWTKNLPALQGRGIILGDGSVLYCRSTDQGLRAYESLDALCLVWLYTHNQIQYMNNPLATDLVNFLDYNAGNVTELKQEIEDLKAKNARLTTDLVSADRKIDRQAKNLRGQDEFLKSAQGEVFQLRKDMETVRGKHQRATKRIADLVSGIRYQNEMQQLRDQKIQDMRQECRTARVSLDTLQRQVVEWQGYYRSAQEGYIEEHGKREAAEKKVTELQRQVDDAVKIIAVRDEEIAYLKSIMEMAKRLPAREVISWYPPFNKTSACGRKQIADAVVAAHYAGLKVVDHDPFRNQRPVDRNFMIYDREKVEEVEQQANLTVFYLVLIVTLIAAGHAYMLFSGFSV